MATRADVDLRTWYNHPITPKKDGFNPSSGRGSSALTALAFTPTHIVEANSLANGEHSPLINTDGNTIASDTIGSASDYGTKCFEMSINQGDTGFGDWGCGLDFPTDLVKGESVHCQFSLYFPSAFNWDADPHLKIFRVHTATSSGGNEGYNDLYLDNGGSRDGHLKQIIEVFENIWTKLNPPPDAKGPWVRDTWETFEYRIDFDNVPLDSGGIGRTRMWRNSGGVMTLILDVTDQKTMKTSTSISDRIYIFTYWNGSSPQNNLCYMDRFVVETDLSKLVETDAGGTKIIGGTSGGLPAANLTVDTFETANMQPTFDVNGFSWGANNETSIVTMDSGPTTKWRSGAIDEPYSNQSLDWTAKEGAHSLRFDYPAGEAMSEQRFGIGTPQSELWFRYWIRVPDNFSYGPSGSPNKFIAIWSDGYSQAGDGSTIWLGFHRTNVTDATIAVTYSLGGFTTSISYQQATPFITTSDQGRWMQIAIRVRAESSLGASDGIIETHRRWEDEQSFTQLHNVTGAPLKLPVGGIDGFQNGYLMGWANAAYAEDTDWLLDTFEVSTESLI